MLRAGKALPIGFELRSSGFTGLALGVFQQAHFARIASSVVCAVIAL